MEKIFTTSETGIKLIDSKEATFLKVKGVNLEVVYATSKEDLEAGKEPYIRYIPIEVSDDLIQKLLSIHEGAKEVVEPISK